MKISLFAVRFQDGQGRHETRRQYFKAHLEWLDQNSEHVLVGESLRKEPDEMPVGSLWIVTAASKKTVEALIKTDPFWQHRLRSSVEILYWCSTSSIAVRPWLYQNGLNIPLLVSEAFSNRIAAFAWLDVLISAVVALVFYNLGR